MSFVDTNSFWPWLFFSSFWSKFLTKFVPVQSLSSIVRWISLHFPLKYEKKKAWAYSWPFLVWSWAWSPKGNFIQFALAKQETVRVNNGITSFLVSDAKVHTYITPPINQKGSDKNENLGQYFWLLCYVIGSANPAQLIRAEFAVQIRFISFKMTL